MLGPTKFFLDKVHVDDILECWIGKQQGSKKLGGYEAVYQKS